MNQEYQQLKSYRGNANLGDFKHCESQFGLLGILIRGTENVLQALVNLKWTRKNEYDTFEVVN